MASSISCTPASPRLSADWPPPSSGDAAARSRRRNVARFCGRSAVDVEHPGRPFVESSLTRLDHSALDQLFDELPHDVAVRAEHHAIEAAIGEELSEAGQAVTLGQLDRSLQLELAGTCERFDGLNAA